ncbi:uncharacterized protein Z518_01826 [Rhinocladiella mackenziei CBS 650.93]|uniref:Rhinocladiella mackenziei CBS 650.93 unplaced genomic scaffold supercont1.2, whole genome shotgun sequence n=1 Tax=Rhinocladiella mackenziei CBS 650.93 TaxID=1442369 RepID=A0A0D2H9K2_9EURO|nr:uncharacterized protein Z518_01826 [Rhinocladiella mackenziei CBS 650.93]KIX07173.1 hypothetical protein Z518_01826 [Rhinocladiella mackenziei CBS 650.93]
MASSSSSDSLSLSTTRSSTKSNMHIPMPPSSSQKSSRHHHHVHIATPHPLASTTQFLDKHVPLFAKHHAEFTAQAELRVAKHEARRSMGATPIPEMEADAENGTISTAIHAATVTSTAPARAGLDEANEAWNAVLAQREAARKRAGSQMTPSEAAERARVDEVSDSDSLSPVTSGCKGDSGSPAITP